MRFLEQILSSRVRAQIFKLLFDGTEKELHVREIARRAGFADGTVRQELAKLLKLDLLKSRKDSNRLYYRANKEHPLYSNIYNLVIKTIGLIDILREALQNKKIKIAFVFGSIASGEYIGESDVDLMVIGSLGLRKVSSLLSGLEMKISREINPYVITEAEFKKRVKSDDHFLTRVLKSPKIFIVGTNDELGSMG